MLMSLLHLTQIPQEMWTTGAAAARALSESFFNLPQVLSPPRKLNSSEHADIS